MRAPKHWINITETSAKHQSSMPSSSSHLATVSSQPQTLPQTSHVNHYPEYFLGLTTVILAIMLVARHFITRRGD